MRRRLCSRCPLSTRPLSFFLSPLSLYMPLPSFLSAATVMRWRWQQLLPFSTQPFCGSLELSVAGAGTGAMVETKSTLTTPPFCSQGSDAAGKHNLSLILRSLSLSLSVCSMRSALVLYLFLGKCAYACLCVRVFATTPCLPAAFAALPVLLSIKYATPRYDSLLSFVGTTTISN